MIVINADDFGMSESTNEAICEAFQDGCLTSTSVLANMPGFSNAVDRYRNLQSMPVGAHISLNMGRPVLPPSEVPALLNRDGYLISSYMAHVRLSRSRHYLDQVKREAAAQICKLLNHGFTLDHINSQSHIHMIAPIFKIFNEIRREFGLQYLRFTHEPWWPRPFNLGLNVIKVATICLLSPRRSSVDGLPTVSFRGLHHSNYLSRYSGEPLELVTHPGYTASNEHDGFQDWVARFIQDPKRVLELRALIDREVNSTVADLGIHTGSFAELQLHA